MDGVLLETVCQHGYNLLIGVGLARRSVPEKRRSEHDRASFRNEGQRKNATRP
jgi:hypothetical protein